MTHHDTHHRVADELDRRGLERVRGEERSHRHRAQVVALVRLGLGELVLREEQEERAEALLLKHAEQLGVDDLVHGRGHLESKRSLAVTRPLISRCCEEGWGGAPQL